VDKVSGWKNPPEEGGKKRLHARHGHDVKNGQSPVAVGFNCASLLTFTRRIYHRDLSLTTRRLFLLGKASLMHLIVMVAFNQGYLQSDRKRSGQEMVGG